MAHRRRLRQDRQRHLRCPRSPERRTDGTFLLCLCLCLSASCSFQGRGEDKIRGREVALRGFVPRRCEDYVSASLTRSVRRVEGVPAHPTRACRVVRRRPDATSRRGFFGEAESGGCVAAFAGLNSHDFKVRERAFFFEATKNVLYIDAPRRSSSTYSARPASETATRARASTSPSVGVCSEREVFPRVPRPRVLHRLAHRFAVLHERHGVADGVERVLRALVNAVLRDALPNPALLH